MNGLRSCGLVLVLLAASAWAQTDEPAEMPPGAWFPVRGRNPALDPELIASIGYAGGITEVPDRVGVLVHDPARVQPGFNFYTSGHAPEAVLMDMEGTALHRWRFPFEAAFPDFEGQSTDEHGGEHWRRARLLPNGSVLAIFEGIGIIKVDRDSQLLWAVQNRAHHDMEVLRDGSIWVLARDITYVEGVNHDSRILEDFLVHLSANGQENRRVSLIRSFDRSDYRELWRGTLHPLGDLFHTNSLRRLDGSHHKKWPAARAGNFLVSMRSLNAIAVIDPEKQRVVWLQSGFGAQHDAHLLPSGNLLLFDNRPRTGRSAVLEFAPGDDDPIWQFDGTEEQEFFSHYCGTASRLPNGNTLIVESNAGRAMEVARNRTVVWEFVSPHRAGQDREFVANLFDLSRIDPSELSWFDRAKVPDHINR